MSVKMKVNPIACWHFHFTVTNMFVFTNSISRNSLPGSSQSPFLGDSPRTEWATCCTCAAWWVRDQNVQRVVEASLSLRLLGHRKCANALIREAIKLWKHFFWEGDLMKVLLCSSNFGRSPTALKLTPNKTGQHVEAFLRLSVQSS